MGAAAYNRGSRRVSMEADERMPVALSRAAQQAHKDEVALLREQIASLERELHRARRCIAAERAGREALRVRLASEERANAFGVGVLCRLAFPGDELSVTLPPMPVAVLETFEVRLRDSVSTYRREKDGTRGLRVTHLRSSIDPKMRPYTFPVEPRWFADRGLVAR